MLDDLTTFDGRNWNGWKTGSATIERGDLVEDGANIHWAGLVDMGSVDVFEPAIKKVFDVELSNKIYIVDYQFRIRKAPDPGQHFLIAVTMPQHRHVRISTPVSDDTPVDTWVGSSSAGTTFFVNSKEIWIGLWRNAGTINPPQWEIEFDDIRVRERT